MSWQRGTLIGLHPLRAVGPGKVLATLMSKRSQLNRLPGTSCFDNLQPGFELRSNSKRLDRITGNAIAVKLNVGGVRFETSLSTLTRYPESLLGRWFSSWNELKEEKFIDFDGSTFGLVLEFLRLGPLMLLPTDARAVEQLFAAAEYFLLTELKEFLTVELAGLAGSSLAEGDLVRFSRFGIESLHKSLLSYAFLSHKERESYRFLGGLHRTGDAWRTHCPGCNLTGSGDRTWNESLAATSEVERLTLLNSMLLAKLAVVKECGSTCVDVKQIGTSSRFHVAKTFLTHY